MPVTKAAKYFVGNKTLISPIKHPMKVGTTNFSNDGSFFHGSKIASIESGANAILSCLKFCGSNEVAQRNGARERKKERRNSAKLTE